jgi:DNA-binding winged helix-turn-helix (wHTH) protein/tetratricopeptide (TPR) repeat protein
VSHVYAFGPFSLDPQNELLLHGSRSIHLTSKAHSTLGLLVERAGQLVSKEEILAAVWPDGFVEPANLTQTIYMLRRALDDGGAELIETIPGKGYRFNAAVRVVARPAPAVHAKADGLVSQPARWAAHIAWVAALCVAIVAVAGLYADRPQRQAPPQNPEVSRDYRLGRYYWNERTISSLNLGIHYFKAALALDPKFGLAHSGLADSYSTLVYYLPWSSQAVPRLNAALREARAAIALDPNGAEGHASLAFADELRGPTYVPEAAREFERSIALNPAYATAHEWYSWFLFKHGHVDGALNQMAQARDLDPVSPAINFAQASQLYFARHYKSASDQWQLAISLLPNSVEGYYGAGLTDDELGDESRAVQEFDRALTIDPGNPDILGALARAYARSGQQEQAIHLLARLRSMKPVPAYEIAVVEETLGERAAAVGWLAVAQSEHDENMINFDVDPRMDDLRRDIARYLEPNA